MVDPYSKPHTQLDRLDAAGYRRQLIFTRDGEATVVTYLVNDVILIQDVMARREAQQYRHEKRRGGWNVWP